VSAVRVLTWNLFHGRSKPPAGRPLLREFATELAGWTWDVALLQEMPPWWLGPLSEAAGADGRGVYTSRNTLLPARRALAMWIPDVVKSEGGGANAILVRGRVKAHRWVELTREPERRVAHGVALEDGRWVANLHASLRPPERVRADAAATLANARAWAAGAHLVVGGDFNWRRPELPGLQRVASHWVDHIFAPDGARDADVLDAGPLSDHRPVAVTVE
jgi:endonuclease/exonuclease/phosphatase family metal-dependent hydrolase